MVATKSKGTVYERERKLRAILKQMSDEDDARHFERVQYAIQLEKIWETEMADPALSMERRQQLDLFVRNIGLGYDELKLAMNHCPKLAEWKRKTVIQIYREALTAKKKENEDRIKARDEARRKAKAEQVQRDRQESIVRERERDRKASPSRSPDAENAVVSVNLSPKSESQVETIPLAANRPPVANLDRLFDAWRKSTDEERTAFVQSEEFTQWGAIHIYNMAGN